MVSVKFSVLFWGLLVLVAQFHSGYSLFLGYKKDLLKHKLYKLKEALLSDHHDDYDHHEEVHHYHHKPHYYYKPLYVSSGYSKWPSYSSSYGYGSYGHYGSYGWPSHYSGWH